MADPEAGQQPFTPGSRHIISIQDVGFGGEGVGRIGDFVVFIPFVITGEAVEVELVDVKKKFARARLISIRKASSERVAPPCRYFGDCGGCQYQHISYAFQLLLKQKQIADLFERVGGFSKEVVSPIIGSPQPYAYRNRIMIRSQWDKFKQGLNIGFIRADNRLVVDIEECKIAEPGLNEAIQHVRKNPPPKGGIKVVLRVPPPDWEVPSDSFFQNNFHLLPSLVETVRARFMESGNHYVIDAYCGVGFFGIELGRLCRAFIGVEIDRRAILSARKNMTLRGLANGEFLEARTEEVLPELLKKYPANETTLILDPPRTGCPPEMLSVLRESGVRQIIYISCHPATLARDLNVLCGGNVFELRQVVPLDMFPQTQHVECVADLRAVG